MKLYDLFLIFPVEWIYSCFCERIYSGWACQMEVKRDNEGVQSPVILFSGHEQLKR